MKKPVDDAAIQAFLAKGGTIKKLPTVEPEEPKAVKPRKKPEPPAATAAQPTVESVFGTKPTRRERTGPTVETVFGHSRKDVD